MKDKIKQISKIALLWCSALFVVVFFCLSGNSIRENIDTFKVCLLLPIAICLFFAPTIIFLIFLCKKLNSKKWKIFWISFLIPFTNMMYYIAMHLPFAPDWGLGTMFLGFLSMLLISVLFVLTIITPSKWLKLKKEFLITEILMLFIGGILIFTTLTAEGIIYDKRINNALNSYTPAIEYIENYKNAHGAYPENINSLKISTPSILPKYKYETTNNGKDYVFKIYDKYENIETYNYCSDKDSPDCKEGRRFGTTYTKIGDWTRAYFDD